MKEKKRIEMNEKIKITAIFLFSAVFLGKLNVYADDEFSDTNIPDESYAAEDTQEYTDTLYESEEINMSALETEEEKTELSEELDFEVENENAGIVSVDLPTASEHAFDFILDPQKLITATHAAKYDNALFEEDQTMYFRNYNNDIYEYSHESDMLTISNTGDTPINVTLEVELLGELTVSQDKEFTDNECVYFELFDSYGNTAVLEDDKKCTISIRIEGADLSGENNSYSFGLTGMCNNEADWTAAVINSEDIGIIVKWKIEPVFDDILTVDLPVIEETDEQTAEENSDIIETSEITDDITESSETMTEISESISDISEIITEITENTYISDESFCSDM